MSQFAVGEDVFVDDRQALEAVELYWHSLPDAQRWELSRELAAAGYHHVVRREALIAWARERLHPERTCGRNPRARRGRRRVSPWIVASAGLPSLGKRR